MNDSGFTDEDSIEEKAILDQQKLETEQFLGDVRKTFGSAHGKRIFTFLLEQGMVSSPLYGESSKMIRNVAVHDFVIENVLGPVLTADEEIYLSIVRSRAEQLRKKEDDDGKTVK
ncbi:hypothetical protein [Maridesulfovibrio bastinii]|uniref:hypothetical protein n=1 Tax=Maridesulfovibrio bastinii TaxID=47157 RepID=UPI000407312D|nr:hypothetical protein [Maridesulfovibrio bastinii]